jgi:hypothetical protein
MWKNECIRITYAIFLLPFTTVSFWNAFGMSMFTDEIDRFQELKIPFSKFCVQFTD